MSVLVTTDSEVSDIESELSSLDLRIRDALSRPSKFLSAYSRTQPRSPRELIKPVAVGRCAAQLVCLDDGDNNKRITSFIFS